MTAHLAIASSRATSDLPSNDRVAGWLLTGPAQLRAGRETGAIAGTLAAYASPAYVYPEIAGYYLQWLAWRARGSENTVALAERAGAVQHWLRVWLASGDPPLTRVHLDGTTDDWRNRAVFCFDLAMVLRGLGSAARARLLAPDAAVIAGVSRQLERLIAADGRFVACVPNVAGELLPDRWSTRRGGFLAKAAAGIVTASHALTGIPAHVVAAANATFAASLISAQEAPHPEVHPLLYTFEGILALPQHPQFRQAVPTMAAQFDALLAHADRNGQLPETLGTPGATPLRVDVIAQALRVGYLLQAHHPARPPDARALALLRQLLEAQVQDSGALAFTLGQRAAPWNVWAAMFAEQALGYPAAMRAPDIWWQSDPLLV